MTTINIKVMKRLFIIGLVALFAVACGKEQKTDKTFDANATAMDYVTMTRDNSWMMGDVLTVDVQDGVMDIFVTPFGMAECSVCDAHDGLNSANRYKELQQKFGDNNQNASTFRYYKNSSGWRLESGVCKYSCYSDKIDNIAIVSDVSWGEQYPAGTDLAPLFTVEFSSLAEYVKRGFTGEPVTQYSEVLSQVNPEHYSLLSADKFSGLHFTTTHQPSNVSDMTISVTLTLDTGEKITYSGQS